MGERVHAHAYMQEGGPRAAFFVNALAQRLRRTAHQATSTLRVAVFALGTTLRLMRAQAAVSHIAVSNALLIIGMFMPKVLLAALFTAALAGLSAMLWATSVARSHDPCSWERATEKNRST